jgi:hypothetical protein
MKMLMDVSIPHETFNAAVRDGSVGDKLKRILEATKLCLRLQRGCSVRVWGRTSSGRGPRSGGARAVGI